MASTRETLNVAVIGAGIAGLSAGIAVRRSCHHVTIYERSTFKNEVGAAITMPPQSSRILRKWGLAGPPPTNDAPYQDLASGKLLRGSRRRNPKTAEILMRTAFEDEEQIYGAAFVSYHRADLHSGLRQLAQDAGVEIVLGKMVVDIDCSNARLTLASSENDPWNETVQKDLIVLADGVNTTFVKAITGREIPARESGRSAFRALIPTEKVLKDPEASQIFADGGEHFMNGCVNPAAGVFMISYPCRGGDLMNVAIIHPVRPEEKSKSDWNSPASVEEALEVIQDFHPAYTAIVKLADPKVYTIRDRDLLPTYVHGRAIIIGDAAHPMFPSMSSLPAMLIDHAHDSSAIAGGGSTAIEDAAALEILLRGIRPSDSSLITQRLALWNALRLPRDVVTQVLSTAMVLPKPASQYADQVRHLYTGYLPDEVLAGWHEGTKAFVCPYDVFDVTRKALEWAEREGYPDDMMLRLQDEGVIKHFGR